MPCTCLGTWTHTAADIYPVSPSIYYTSAIPTWTPKVCNISAFQAISVGLGYDSTYCGGPSKILVSTVMQDLYPQQSTAYTRSLKLLLHPSFGLYVCRTVWASERGILKLTPET